MNSESSIDLSEFGEETSYYQPVLSPTGIQYSVSELNLRKHATGNCTQFKRFCQEQNSGKLNLKRYNTLVQQSKTHMSPEKPIKNNTESYFEVLSPPQSNHEPTE